MALTPPNATIAEVVVGPIDRTASDPSISFGADAINNSGTGIRGDFDSIDMSIAGSDVVSVEAAMVALKNDAKIKFSAGPTISTNAGAPVAQAEVKGSLIIDSTNGALYINTGTAGAPVWVQLATVP